MSVKRQKRSKKDCYEIHLALLENTSLARGILKGFADYGGHRINWRCGLVGRQPDFKAGPPNVDALLGILSNKWLELKWDQEACRRVINLSRSAQLPNVATLCCDDQEIGRLAAEYFLGKGLKYFAFFGDSRTRGKAFAARLVKEGYSCEYIFNENPVYEERKLQLEQQLAALPLRTGIMAFNDHEAVALLWSLQKLGRAVPEDVAVIGVDADHVQSLMSPVPITSVDPNFRQIGYRAGALLELILNGYDARGERTCVAPAGIIEQASSDFPAISDEIVIEAARYIRRYACSGITASDVINAVPLSRRPLERRFRVVFNRTILEEIQRVRITEVVRLLVHTDYPVSMVATQTGFASHARLSQVFGGLMEMSPREYRSRHKNDAE